jgi:DNA processing protein
MGYPLVLTTLGVSGLKERAGPAVATVLSDEASILASNIRSIGGGRVADVTREQAAVLALTKVSPAEWYRTATVIMEAGSACDLLEGRPRIMADEHCRYAEELLSRIKPEDLDLAEATIERLAAEGVRLLTVLDDDYPTNLQLIYNRPPFIWVRGQLNPRDVRAIAVVGTRNASEKGRKLAAQLARELVDSNVTVLSGLARGIDTAAHSSALEAGGRTVAVIGNGILRPTYPPENAQLADQIAENGAIVSQFWPDAPPRSIHFPMRNVVMSGLASGTVVVEASSTSGAKMQARLALEHGKRLFLLESLVMTQEWARKYAKRPGVTIVRGLDDVLDVLVKLVEVPQQLALNL